MPAYSIGHWTGIPIYEFCGGYFKSNVAKKKAALGAAFEWALLSSLKRDVRQLR
jgi:hypothetical protein